MAELRAKRMMVPEHDAYAIKYLTGGCPCPDSLKKQISHYGPIDAPQFCYDGAKVGPPRLQFSVRHEWLRVTGRQRTPCAAGGGSARIGSPACELSAVRTIVDRP
jgi:hypothetical protein